MSRDLNNEIFLKREDMQPVFSFKLRGAYNKMFSLSKEEKEKGVTIYLTRSSPSLPALSAAVDRVLPPYMIGLDTLGLSGGVLLCRQPCARGRLLRAEARSVCTLSMYVRARLKN